MTVPLGYDATFPKNVVCRLKKTLYGLKQSPRAWFGKFSQALLKLGYNQSDGDHTLFVKVGIDGRMVVLLVYEDDIIITRDDTAEIQSLSQKLCQ